MKRIALFLLLAVFCCSAFSAGADTAHVAEDLYAQSDYIVLSPEYSESKGLWELWALAYRRAPGSGEDNTEKDRCVSASLLSMSNPAAAAGTLSVLLAWQYELEDMMEFDGIRYYMFLDFSKKCYLASPGGSLTTTSPVSVIEIHDTKQKKTVYMQAPGSDPAFMTLCQLWLYAGWYNQKPSSITKTYGMDPETEQPLYSNDVKDYCSNQDKLQQYCETLIPAVSYVSSGDTDKPHFSTDIYYRRGDTQVCVSPGMDSLVVLFTAGPK